jgi:hypothetical protein
MSLTRRAFLATASAALDAPAPKRPNIDADRTELHDIAAVHGDRARDLSASWDVWASNAGVLPWGEVNKRQTNR